MMRPSLLLVLPLFVTSMAKAAPAPPEGPKVIRLAPQVNAKQDRALRYRLLPGVW